jgi:hypothetical protein
MKGALGSDTKGRHGVSSLFLGFLGSTPFGYIRLDHHLGFLRKFTSLEVGRTFLMFSLTGWRTKKKGI